MSKTFFEKIDVFLPGQGEELTQAPGYHWEHKRSVPTPKSTTGASRGSLSEDCHDIQIPQ